MVNISSRSSCSVIALLVPRLDQQGQHVGAAGGPLSPTPRDFGTEDSVEFASIADEATPRREAPQLDLERGDREEGRGRAAEESQHAEQRVAYLGELGALIEPEDRSQDDGERDRLHLAMDRKHVAERPAVDDAVGDLAHEAPVERHSLAVERRHDEAALASMARAVKL